MAKKLSKAFNVVHTAACIHVKIMCGNAVHSVLPCGTLVVWK